MGKSPMQWQIEAAARAAEENVIVFAETGAGKTMVAELAIKEALLRQPDKRCAFLVTATRLLAHQQYQRLREALREEGILESDAVVEVTGYTTSDWNRAAWTNCYDRAQVLVGTIETFARAVIDHGYLQLSNFSLLVVDEAHKATGDSPGAELLHRLSAGGSSVPRVVGLTASYANDGAKTWEEFQESRRNLQAIFRAKMHVCTVPPRKKPQFRQIPYACSRLEMEAQSAAKVVCQMLWQHLRNTDLKEPKETEKLIQQLAELLTELGSDGFHVGLKVGFMAQIQGRIDNFSKIVEQKRLAERFKADLVQLEQSLKLAADCIKDLDALRSFTPKSEKLEALLRCLEAEFYEDPEDLKSKVKDSCGMVFVSQVALALPLATVLDELLPGVAVGAVSGVTSMTEKQRNDAFSEFRCGQTQLLVCTKCAEEGLDVAECSFVVRFNHFDTTRSHVQGVGRARAEEARIYYFDNCPLTECHLAEVMEAVAREPEGEVVRSGPVPSYCQRSSVHPFTVLGSTAEVNFRSAPRILSRYFSQTSGYSFRDLEFPGGLLIPGPHGGLKLMESDVRDFMAPHVVDTKTAMKYVATLALHRRGWLDGNNCVPKRIIAASRAWQKSIGGADDFECLDLKFMVSQSHKQLSATRRDREGSSGLEQVDLGRRHLKPEEIENTQLTVNTTFSCGGSVMKAMALLVTGAQRIEDFPPIRVAWSEEGQRWYSADNRRLFIYKVIAPLMDMQTVEVAEINWTSEFDCKNRQTERFGKVWATHKKSVEQVRNQLLEAMARGDDLGKEPDPLYDERSESLLAQVPMLEAAWSGSEAEAPEEVDEVAEAEANTEYHLPLEPSKNLSRLELGDLSQGLPSKRERCVKFKLEEEPPTPASPGSVVHGDDAEELLRRVGQTLAKCQNRQEEVAVTLLKEVLECHCRLKDNQKLPLDFEPVPSPHFESGFRVCAVVCGQRFLGACCGSKREARRKAAVAAIRGLIGEESGQSCSEKSDSEESWEVLEDCEVLEEGTGEYLRVELVLEPDHQTSCQCFRPKAQLLEHLEQSLGRAPNVSECRFAFKGWQRFWRCRVELQLPALSLCGSFEGTPAQTPEQAEQNAAWRVLEKLKLIKVVRLHRDQRLQDALRTLPNADNLELFQDGCVVSGDVQVSQLSSLRFEVRDAEPW